MEKIKIAIVDDHALFRLGVKSVINKTITEATLVGDYSSAEEFLIALQQGATKPDIILLDILMDGLNGIDTAKILREKYPNIKIIVLSSEIEEDTILTMVDIGVDGYLSKMVVEADLKKAINTVMNNSIFYGKDISRILFSIWQEKKQNSPKLKRNLLLKTEKEFNNTLTDREYDVIEMLCEGASSNEVAQKLHISPRTVERHRANIMEKLGFHNIVDLVKYAINKGIVSL